MERKTILFTVDGDSISPKTEQKAGVQGQHNITEVRFEGDILSEAKSNPNEFKVRIHFIDGAGGFYSSGFLDVMSDEEDGTLYVTCPIPDNVTNAGGVAHVHLVVTNITYEGEKALENQVYISPPGKLLYTHSGVGSPSEYAYRMGISGALINAEKFAGRAEEASEAAEETKLKVETAEADAYESAKQANKNATDADKSAKSAAASAEAAKSAQEAAEKEKTKAENAAIKAEEAAEKTIAFGKANSLVFDTKEHLNQFIGGYESTKNLCPLPRIDSTDYYSLTHNDNGTFNFDVSHHIGEPVSFGSITLEPGVYVFTRYNCEFFIGITLWEMIPISKPFEVTETTEYDLFSSGYAGDSFKNAWVQITKGESVPDEFIPYYAPYTREDGKTVNDLSPGDILLITEEGVSDYWWDGNAIRPIEAQADQTFNRESENAQSGIAIDKYVTDNFSDIIIETSHSVNSPAEIDCCLKGQKIVGGNIFGSEPIISANVNQLYLPKNPIIHFSPTNPIKNRTFIGDGITIEQAGTALHYAFAGDYNVAFNENDTKIEVGQEYIMRFDVTCTYQNNPSKWGFGVFSKKQYSSACNVATKSLVTVKEAGTGAIAYQSDPQNMSYTTFSVYSPMNNGQRYIVELVFTSSYSGEVYFGMRSEGASITVDLISCLFCKTESLPMLVDQKINTNLLSIGNIYDSIDLVTGQKIQQIMIDELSFDTKQYWVTYGKALPSVPIYLISGTLDNPDWVRKIYPQSGTNDYYFNGLLNGHIVYATRTPVTEQLELELPTVCTDEFEVYTSSDDNVMPYFQTSVDTKKSANSYLKKISNAIISMGGNV